MADFPRIKWLNIKGQQVPFTEPQHFTGNSDETVRTGHDNPLPVANYTKKGNIWLPVSEDNPMPTQVTGSKVENSRFDFDEIAPGQVITQSISPENGVWKVISLGFAINGNTFELNINFGGHPNLLGERYLRLSPSGSPSQLLVEGNIIIQGKFTSDMRVDEQEKNDVYYSRISGQLVSAETPLILRVQNKDNANPITTARVFIVREVLK